MKKHKARDFRIRIQALRDMAEKYDELYSGLIDDWAQYQNIDPCFMQDIWLKYDKSFSKKSRFNDEPFELIGPTITNKETSNKYVKNMLRHLLMMCSPFPLSKTPEDFILTVPSTTDIYEEIFHTIEVSLQEKEADYYDEDYRRCRLEVMLRDGEVCAKCGARPSEGKSMTIDHIKPVSKHPELFLDKDNMQVLCWECNKSKSNKHSTDYRGK
jgi:hypothetical protein